MVNVSEFEYTLVRAQPLAEAYEGCSELRFKHEGMADLTPDDSEGDLALGVLAARRELSGSPHSPGLSSSSHQVAKERSVGCQGPVVPALEECPGLRGHSVLGRIPEEERPPEGDDDELDLRQSGVTPRAVPGCPEQSRCGSSISGESGLAQVCFRGWPKKRHRANTACVGRVPSRSSAGVDKESSSGVLEVVAAGLKETGFPLAGAQPPAGRTQGVAAKAPNAGAAPPPLAREEPRRGPEPAAELAFMMLSAGVPRAATSRPRAAFAR